MQNEFTYHKHKFEIALAPLLELLEFKKATLTFTDWIKFLESTKLSIINNPEQYLGQELPSREMVEHIVQEIFEEMNAIA